MCVLSEDMSFERFTPISSHVKENVKISKIKILKFLNSCYIHIAEMNKLNIDIGQNNLLLGKI